MELILYFKEISKFFLAGFFGSVVKLFFSMKKGVKYSKMGLFVYGLSASMCIFIAYMYVRSLDISNDYKMIISVVSGWVSNSLVNFLYENEKNIIKRLVDKFIK